MTDHEHVYINRICINCGEPPEPVRPIVAPVVTPHVAAPEAGIEAGIEAGTPITMTGTIGPLPTTDGDPAP